MQLLGACQKSPQVKRLVVKSSTNVYGSAPRDPAVFTETTLPKSLPSGGFAKEFTVEVEGTCAGSPGAGPTSRCACCGSPTSWVRRPIRRSPSTLAAGPADRLRLRPAAAVCSARGTDVIEVRCGSPRTIRRVARSTAGRSTSQVTACCCLTVLAAARPADRSSLLPAVTWSRQRAAYAGCDGLLARADQAAHARAGGVDDGCATHWDTGPSTRPPRPSRTSYAAGAAAAASGPRGGRGPDAALPVWAAPAPSHPPTQSATLRSASTMADAKVIPFDDDRSRGAAGKAPCAAEARGSGRRRASPLPVREVQPLPVQRAVPVPEPEPAVPEKPEAGWLGPADRGRALVPAAPDHRGLRRRRVRLRQGTHRPGPDVAAAADRGEVLRVEVKGVENIPSEGGGADRLQPLGDAAAGRPDACRSPCDNHPAERHLRLLAADLVFMLPVVNELARKAGHTLACAGVTRSGCSRSVSWSASLPGGLQGHRQAVQRAVQVAAVRPRRLRRPRPCAPGRRSCR